MEKKVIVKTRQKYKPSEKVTDRIQQTTQQLGSVLKGGGAGKVLRSNIPSHPPVSTTIENQEQTELDSLKISVKNLSGKDRQMLLDYILLLKQNEKPTSDQERKFAMWTDSLNLALTQMLGQTHSIFPHSLITQAKKILKDVTDFMSENDLANLQTGETKAMYNLLAKLLVNHASMVSAKARIPLSMKLVLQTTTPVVAIFDNHFPGYVKGKLIKQVLFASARGITEEPDDEND